MTTRTRTAEPGGQPAPPPVLTDPPSPPPMMLRRHTHHPSPQPTGPQPAPPPEPSRAEMRARNHPHCPVYYRCDPHSIDHGPGKHDPAVIATVISREAEPAQAVDAVIEWHHARTRTGIAR